MKIYGLTVPALLVILPFTINKSRCSTILRTSDRVENVANGPRSSNLHNVTVDCGDYNLVKKTVWQCQRDVYQLALAGYPWSPHRSQRHSTNDPNVTDRDNNLKDALDSLNYVCHIYDRSQTCLQESGKPDYCLYASADGGTIHSDFQFICHHQQRDVNLAHSLQCLHNTRLLVMLYFHIADRCRGFGILDDIMRRYKHAYFYTLDVNPFGEQPFMSRLYCVPKDVVSTCIRDIIKDQCGVMAADLVQNYLLYSQDYFAQVLKSAGLKSDICDSDISSDTVSSKLPVRAGHTKLGISRLLEMTAPGTALDTVRGKFIMGYLHSLSKEDLCSTQNVATAYGACVMSSDDKAERSQFNILQFSAYRVPLALHGTQCSRLEQFTECWKLLQETCGPRIRGLEQHATLMMEGCEIQSELDTVGCHWQDMLLPHYIHASRVTVWPTVGQCLSDQMLLEGTYYSSFDSVMHDLDALISLLQPGVEEISSKCGSRPAKRITSLLSKLRYLQRDAMKYRILLSRDLPQ